MTFSTLIPVPTYGIEDLERSESFTDAPPPECTFDEEPAELSYKALKIARAKSGTNEIRLLAKLSDGKPSGFTIQTAITSPYTRDQKDLVGENNEPLSESEAVAAFEQAVAKQYPPCILRTGTLVPTYLSLL